MCTREGFLDPKQFFFYYAFTEQCTRGHSGGFFIRVLQKPLWLLNPVVFQALNQTSIIRSTLYCIKYLLHFCFALLKDMQSLMLYVSVQFKEKVHPKINILTFMMFQTCVTFSWNIKAESLNNVLAHFHAAIMNEAWRFKASKMVKKKNCIKANKSDLIFQVFV